MSLFADCIPGTRAPAEAPFLKAYFERIGFGEGDKADLATLRRIHLLHPQAIAFENFTPLLGQPVSLKHDDLVEKLVRRGRGGYCYEQNLLFARALAAVGFPVQGLMARVLWNNPQPERVPPRTHMLLLVEVDGEQWVADVGFGGMTPTAPLRLAPGLEQPTPHGHFRLLEAAGQFRLEALVAGDWKPVYTFDLQQQYEADYQVANWYVSTHGSSHFTHQLIATRPGEGCRHALHNLAYTRYGADGGKEKRQLHEPDELVQLLQEVFRLRLDGLPLEDLFRRLQLSDVQEA